MSLLAATKTFYIYLRFLRTRDQAAEVGAVARARNENLPNMQMLRYHATQVALANSIPVLAHDIHDEGDVYLRYLQVRRKVKYSVTPKMARSVFLGVFPIFDGPSALPKWTASFSLSGPKPAPKALARASKDECLAALRALAKAEHRTVNVANPKGGFKFDT